MVKFDLYSRTKYVEPEAIKNNCTDGEEIDLQESFENLEEAEKALKKYSSSVYENYKQLGKILVTEFFLEKETIDDDGSLIVCELIKFADGLEESNKKFKVEVFIEESQVWSPDLIEDVVEAVNEEEAIEFAKDYLKDTAYGLTCDEHDDYCDEVDNYYFRAIEIEDEEDEEE